MKSSLLVRIIFSVIVAIFVINFFVVLVYFPLSSSSSEVSPLMLKLQSHEAFGNFDKKNLRENHQRQQQQRAPPKADEKRDRHLGEGRTKKNKTSTTAYARNYTSSTSKCPIYGCPVYPPELITPITNQTIWKAMKASGSHNAKQRWSEFEFASDTFATLSLQGASHKVNQDRGLYVSPFLPDLLSSASKSKTTEKSFLACIFDGHGNLGHKVAQEVTEKFPLLLAEKMRLALGGKTTNNIGNHDVNHNQSGGIKNKNTTILISREDFDSTDIAIRKALNETFLEVNEKGDPSTFFLGGCTASVTLRWGSKLYIANTGDSETIVVSALPSSKQQTPNMQQQQQQQQQQNLPIAKVEYATRRDKANQPDERARIEKLGGKIHINAKGFDPRVIVHSEVAHDIIGLAMSRSIGDWEWKAVGVTAEPTIDVIDLSKPLLSDSDKTIFLLAASDGFWEKRQKHFFSTRLAASFRNDKKGKREINEVSANLRPLYHLYDVIKTITPKNQNGYIDDITATIVSLE